MYSEWASLSPVIAANSNGSSSTVLNKFSSVAGREVSQSVVKQLASNLGITQSPEPSILVTDDEVSVFAFRYKSRRKFTELFSFYTGELVHECHLSWFVYAYIVYACLCGRFSFTFSMWSNDLIRIFSVDGFVFF